MSFKQPMEKYFVHMNVQKNEFISLFPNRDQSKSEELEKNITEGKHQLLSSESFAYKRVLDNQGEEIGKKGQKERVQSKSESLSSRMMDERGWLYEAYLQQNGR